MCIVSQGDALAQNSPPPTAIDQRVYSRAIRRELNANLKAQRIVIWSIAVALEVICEFRFHTLLIPGPREAIFAGAGLIADGIVSSRFTSFRRVIQEVLSNRYRRDFSKSTLVGVSPGKGGRGYDGDDSWDVGFISFDRDSLTFYGDACSFTLGAHGFRCDKKGKKDFISVEWWAVGQGHQWLTLRAKHCPHHSLKRARNDLRKSLYELSLRPFKAVEEGLLPPQLESGQVVLKERLPITLPPLIAEAPRRRTQFDIERDRELADLIWICDCTEVNIRSHLNCRICGAAQPPRGEAYTVSANLQESPVGT